MSKNRNREINFYFLRTDMICYDMIKQKKRDSSSSVVVVFVEFLVVVEFFFVQTMQISGLF